MGRRYTGLKRQPRMGFPLNPSDTSLLGWTFEATFAVASFCRYCRTHGANGIGPDEARLAGTSAEILLVLLFEKLRQLDAHEHGAERKARARSYLDAALGQMDFC